MQAQVLVNSEVFNAGSIVYGGEVTSLGYRLPLRALVESVETKLFYMAAPMIASMQNNLRENSELFSENEVYRELIQQRADIYEAELRDQPEISSLLRFVRVFSNSSPEQAEVFKVEITNWLNTYNDQIESEFQANGSPALYLELKAQTKAIDSILTSVNQNNE